jgi:hypothetical protein
MHNTSRVDSKFDLHGSYDEIVGKAIAIAKRRKVKMSQTGDWIGATSGRTLYLGSRASATYIRIYEKGREDITYAKDTVRVEIEMKPPTPAGKAKASSLSATDCWGATPLSRELYEVLTGSYPAPVRVGRQVKTPSDLEERLMKMTLTYKTLLGDALKSLGGDADALGRVIGSALKGEPVSLPTVSRYSDDLPTRRCSSATSDTWDILD